jgi:hypothetical protein
MVVLRGVEMVWLELGLVLHSFRALILLVSGLSPLWLMSDAYNVAFLVYFRLFSYVILTGPPINE